MPDNQLQLTNNGNSSAVLFIRADASSRIGTGHVMRCIALGQTWLDASRHQTETSGQQSEANLSSVLRPPTSVKFICAEIPDALAARVKSEGFDLIRINAEPGSPEDLRQTLSILSNFRSQVSAFSPPSSSSQPSSDLCPPTSVLWLVADGYHFNLDYQRGIRADGIKLLLIDDYNHLPEYEADILLNQNIGAEEIEYRCNPECRKLLGTRYVMLRREFRNRDAMSSSCFPEVGSERSERGSVIAGQRPEGSAKKVLVTLGGADPDNVTLKVIQALNRLDIPDLQVKVIVGPANPHLDSLKQALSSTTIHCELINSVRDMPGLMQWANLAVSAAGSTSWELCCTGVPFVTVILTENQKGLAAELDRRGVAGCLGENPAEGDIASAVGDLAAAVERRTACSARGREWVDGFGVYRVLHRPAQDMGLEVFNGHLSLRPASGADMERFWEWANDPAVRANCYNPEPIPLEKHREWFSDKLALDQVLMLVLELDGHPAGQIRYDVCDGAAVIGFSVDFRFRGLGLGRRIVGQSLGWAFSSLGVGLIRAEVFQSNVASQAVFRKTGFELAETCEIKGVPSFVFVRKRA
jgi:UDP-2,4-diacetamido-2,4,6-trideoxy-beta-L-altropyranose hydrolase